MTHCHMTCNREKMRQRVRAEGIVGALFCLVLKFVLKQKRPKTKKATARRPTRFCGWPKRREKRGTPKKNLECRNIFTIPQSYCI
jgi:hypothetical protein